MTGFPAYVSGGGFVLPPKLILEEELRRQRAQAEHPVPQRGGDVSKKGGSRVQAGRAVKSEGQSQPAAGTELSHGCITMWLPSRVKAEEWPDKKGAWDNSVSLPSRPCCKPFPAP